MSLDPRIPDASWVPTGPPQSAAALFERIAPDLERAEREERARAPHLSPDELRDLALRRSLAALGQEISRGTFVYLRWRLTQASAAAEATRAESAALRERTTAVRAEVRASRRTMADAAAGWPGRRHYHDADYREWCVHEISMADADWARAPRCLLFSSAECLRRVWSYPAEWWRLSDAELEALSWRS